MSEQPPAWPEWAPDDLVRRYQERSTEEDRRLKRLLTDPRMEKVWAAIRKRTDNTHYPTILYFRIELWLSCVSPPNSPASIKKQHNALAFHLRRAIKILPGSALADREILLAEMERVSIEVADSFCLSFAYVGTVTRVDKSKSQKETMLIRKLHGFFMETLNQPLWETVTTLVNVCLEPEIPVTSNKVRSSCACC